MGVPFNPISDIPDQSGRVFFVTGGTAGLGAGFISLLAAHNPAHIFFSGRSAKKAKMLISDIIATFPNVKLSFIECDLTSLTSVKQAATRLLSESQRLDVLMCNAGVMALKPGVSKDGYEIQFATNHLGHALLIKSLLPRLLHTAAQPGTDVRIINLTSTSYTRIPQEAIHFDSLRSDQAGLGTFALPGNWMRYGQSKLANLLYAQELARRYPSIMTVAVHPGYVHTGITDSLGFVDRIIVRMATRGNIVSVEEGPYNQTWAATTSRGSLENGAFYKPVGIIPEFEVPQASDRYLAKRLWEWTERELADY